MICFFIRSAATVSTICNTAMIPAAVFPKRNATRHSNTNTAIATVVTLLYVFSLRHLSDALSLILSAKDFGASDFGVLALAGSL